MFLANAVGDHDPQENPNARPDHGYGQSFDVVTLRKQPAGEEKQCRAGDDTKLFGNRRDAKLVPQKMLHQQHDPSQVTETTDPDAHRRFEEEFVASQKQEYESDDGHDGADDGLEIQTTERA